MTQHRSNYKKYLNGKRKYYSAFKVMENKDYDIILIEDYPCNSKDQLFARERYYTNTIECVNIRKNQGRMLELGKKEYHKDYYKENTDKIKLRSKEYREKNIDEIKDYMKEYREKNAEKIQIKRKEYCDKNNEKRNEKFTCPCGGKYCYSSRSTHMKTKKHQKYLEEQTENDN